MTTQSLRLPKAAMMRWWLACTPLLLTTLFAVGRVQAQGLGRIVVGAPFPDIALPALADGRRMTMEAFRGKRVLLLVFASW